MRHPRSLSAALLLLLTGCGTLPITPMDEHACYGCVFQNVRAPEPQIVHAWLEQTGGSLFSSSSNDWAFELIVSRAWLDEIKPKYIPPRFALGLRPNLPEWFKPTETDYEMLEMPYGASSSSAHLYIEKATAGSDRIHVYIHRH